MISQTQASPHVRRLADLNHRIAEYEILRANVAGRLQTSQRAASRAWMGYAYRRLQLALRGPSKSYDLWPIGVMLVGPLAIAGSLFAIVQIQSGSFGAAFLALALAAVIAAALFACLLFVPGNPDLNRLTRDAGLRRQTTKQQAISISGELARLDESLRKDREARDEILKSVQYGRELLLLQNWKAMRGGELEAFLAKAFHLLGGVVEARGQTGDQGVDLIVELNNLRYAIQVKGYESSVGNGAVQEAVAGMAHCKCNRSVVITNSRFTQAAYALAASNNCRLIGEDEFADLVLGNTSL